MTLSWAKSTALAMMLAAPVQAQPAGDTVSQVEALAGEARAQGQRFAEAEGLFIAIPIERFGGAA